MHKQKNKLNWFENFCKEGEKKQQQDACKQTYALLHITVYRFYLFIKKDNTHNPNLPIYTLQYTVVNVSVLLVH